MLLALAIAATFMFAEVVTLVVLLYIHDGLKGVEIWMGINTYLAILVVIVGIVAGVVALWVAAI